MAATLQLLPGREKSLKRRHPWVFSGAVASVQPDPADGETVRIIDSQGEFLAWGAYSRMSQIRARVWSWEQAKTVDADFFRRRLSAALALRQDHPDLRGVDGLRLVHGESDGLPGLVVDRYSDALVIQFLSSGPERWRETLCDLLSELTGAARLYERSDVDVRKLEGLPLRSGLLRGEPGRGRVIIHEGDLRFTVDLQAGHKTGFYLDQRFNRRRVAQLAAGREMLDCFCYTGGFSVHALAAGAAATLMIDASAEALALARENLAVNGLDDGRAELQAADVFVALRGLRDRRHSFDLIVLDPPKFAQTAAQVERAARGYKDINLLAFKLLRPGGLLATFSCSGGVSAELFQKIVAGAALDAGMEAQVLERLDQAPDHPVALNFPEGAYLKGLIVRVSAA